MRRCFESQTSAWRDGKNSTPPRRLSTYFCECADTECRAKVPLRRSDYERIRADAKQFFVVPGHEILDVETVVERHDDEGWVVVAKPPEVAETLERTNPRRS